MFVSLIKNKTKGNYRYIACLNLFWKYLIGIISENSYEPLLTNTLLPDYQKEGFQHLKALKTHMSFLSWRYGTASGLDKYKLENAFNHLYFINGANGINYGLCKGTVWTDPVKENR